MPLSVGPAFTWNVTAGFLVSLLGVIMVLAASVWWERTGAWAGGGQAPLACRALCAVALGLFSVGLIWQLLGYLQLEYTAWWTW